MTGTRAPDASRALMAQCGDCGHVWPIAYYPNPVDVVVRAIGRKPTCPKCAGVEVFPAPTAAEGIF